MAESAPAVSFELVLEVPQALVEAVSDALMLEHEALSVSVEDAEAGTDAETSLFGEPGLAPTAPGWQRSTLRALFDGESAATRAAMRVLAAANAPSSTSSAANAPSTARSAASEPALPSSAAPTPDATLIALRPVPAVDWVRLTQSQFAPVAITPSFWVVPSWHEPPAAARTLIRLDPGLAFGTGTHPTTQLCLRWIASQPAERSARWHRVLDYGTGSGILAIAAALHGGRGIDAVDIDPAAVEAARLNAAANGVALTAGPPDAAAGAYPLVVANILATPLKLLAPLLFRHLAAGGDLVLAGILARQADELQAAYRPFCDLRVDSADDGWVLMTTRRDA